MASKNPSPKTIIFKSDQHTAIISEKLQNFYEQNEFFDTVLIAGSNSVTIQAHRVILCALSEFFLEIFRGDQSALNGNIVELKEIEASTLKIVIDFIYSGSIELSVETVGGILRTASFLKIKSLVDGCCELIEENIDSNNSLSWFRLGYELSLATLKTKAKICTYTHFKEILTQKEFLMLSENELTDLLFNDNPYDKIEEDIFLAMVAWINFDKLNRKHLVLQLLSIFRFQNLSPKFIVENRKSVCETIESYELICSWLQWHLSPETRTNDQGNCVEARSNNQHDCTFKTGKVMEKKKKLAVIKIFPGRQNIQIETFNPKENVWSTEIETHTPLKVFADILIDDKLIVSLSKDLSGYSYGVKCLNLHTSEWTDLPSIKKDRYIWKMVDLNGNLCVLGCDSYYSVSTEIYNFSTRMWHDTQPLAQPSPKVKIATHNEMLYLLDFDHGCLQSYNVSSNKWTLKEIKKDLLRSYEFAAVEGFLYIIGGKNYATRKRVDTVKRYNLSNDSWCEVASLPLISSVLRSTVFENKIIVSVDKNVFEYCSDSDTWNTLTTINNNTFTFDSFSLTTKS